MICLSTMRDVHQAAAARWREQQTAQLSAREHRKRLRAMRAEMRRENATKPNPDPVCKRCGVVHAREDRDWLFPSRCGTCGIQRLERLVWRIVKRHGRRKTVRLLRRLADGK